MIHASFHFIQTVTVVSIGAPVILSLDSKASLFLKLTCGGTPELRILKDTEISPLAYSKQPLR